MPQGEKYLTRCLALKARAETMVQIMGRYLRIPQLLYWKEQRPLLLAPLLLYQLQPLRID